MSEETKKLLEGLSDDELNEVLKRINELLAVQYERDHDNE